MRKIKAGVKKSSSSVLGMAIGPLLLVGSWVPPGAASDRPDTKLRKGVDPRNPPSGYYEDSSPPLRRQVLGGLTSLLVKIRGKEAKVRRSTTPKRTETKTP